MMVNFDLVGILVDCLFKKGKSLARTPFDFCIVDLTWVWKFSFPSIVTPRYLMVFVHGISAPLICRCRSYCFLLNNMAFVFCTLSLSHQVSNQFVATFSWRWTVTTASRLGKKPGVVGEERCYLWWSEGSRCTRRTRVVWYRLSTWAFYIGADRNAVATFFIYFFLSLSARAEEPDVARTSPTA